eukprot:126268-Rhodomonas_salina.1
MAREGPRACGDHGARGHAGGSHPFVDRLTLGARGHVEDSVHWLLAAAQPMSAIADWVGGGSSAPPRSNTTPELKHNPRDQTQDEAFLVETYHGAHVPEGNLLGLLEVETPAQAEASASAAVRTRGRSASERESERG